MEQSTEISRPRRPDEVRVLIVEDDPRVRKMLVRVAQVAGFAVLAVWSGEQAAMRHAQTPFDIAILDYHLPQMNGLQTLEKLRQTNSDLQAIVLTGYADLDVAKQAIHLDVVEFLTKPCQRGELEQALNRALRRKNPVAHLPADLELKEPHATVHPIQTIEEAEREMILQSLRRNNGNRAAAARELGITRRTLHNKINAYQSQGYAIP